MTLNKARIIDRIYNSTDLNRTQATRTVEALLGTIKEGLENGEDVLIRGLGQFRVKQKNQ